MHWVHQEDEKERRFLGLDGFAQIICMHLCFHSVLSLCAFTLCFHSVLSLCAFTLCFHSVLSRSGRLSSSAFYFRGSRLRNVSTTAQYCRRKCQS
jgi:hypothetical protein